MGGLVFATLKVAFLGLVWLFIALVALVIRTDISDGQRQDAAPKPNPKRRGARSERTPRLIVIAGPGIGDSVPLTGEITIGRSPECVLDISDDFASTYHARLSYDEDSWIITDLGSTNGTHVNGVAITTPTRVSDRDIIRIGASQLKLEA
jgi:pSer/pThr/pTyr-binding forkhead associated (FHA) protein